jgi:hypothetical protein
LIVVLAGHIITGHIVEKIRDAVKGKYGKDSSQYKNAKFYNYEEPPAQQTPPTPSYIEVPSLKRKKTNEFPPTKRYNNLSKNNFADEQIRLAKKLFTAR